jgi:hypothetical protein
VTGAGGAAPGQGEDLPGWPATRYEIRVEGVLDQHWSPWFDGLRITSRGGVTTLRGPVVDQAALLGLLAKAHDLGLSLISVRRVDPGRPSGRPGG